MEDEKGDRMARVVFVHPDLGIGGAERLVVDAAVAVQAAGHHVTVWTSHHDPRHAFPETTDGSLRVVTAGDWLPRSVLGRAVALCAYLRMAYLALYVALLSGEVYDVAFCDQVSACVPLLRLRNTARVIFYCHFPDLLLSRHDSRLRRLYRGPIDWLEERTTAAADLLLVNSKFTANVLRETFPSLARSFPEVVYPCVDATHLREGLPADLPAQVPRGNTALFLSVNRYERKKALGLALEAVAELRDMLSPAEWAKVHLVQAGGFDPRLPENAEVFAELTDLASSLHLSGSVTLLRSPSEQVKRALFAAATAVVYTPSREHLGIVPLEAMAAGKPVVAVSSGGPCETVAHGVTGLLCPPEPKAFADALLRLLRDPDLVHTMGRAGQERVAARFSPDAFCRRLDALVQTCCARG
uniref:alpha-1,3/1,6-mannosyltransferase ALG2 n=1 Tax=Myxine glutinosa TaxID=7769 RepID=UPI00358EA0F0